MLWKSLTQSLPSVSQLEFRVSPNLIVLELTFMHKLMKREVRVLYFVVYDLIIYHAVISYSLVLRPYQLDFMFLKVNLKLALEVYTSETILSVSQATPSFSMLHAEKKLQNRRDGG